MDSSNEFLEVLKRMDSMEQALNSHTTQFAEIKEILENMSLQIKIRQPKDDKVKHPSHCPNGGQGDQEFYSPKIHLEVVAVDNWIPVLS